jgi:hypothetical protein
MLRYILIPPEIIKILKISIPLFYENCFFYWYCPENNSILLREKSIEDMDKIGLIILTKKIGETLKTIEARLISNQF